MQKKYLIVVVGLLIVGILSLFFLDEGIIKYIVMFEIIVLFSVLMLKDHINPFLWENVKSFGADLKAIDDELSQKNKFVFYDDLILVGFIFSFCVVMVFPDMFSVCLNLLFSFFMICAFLVKIYYICKDGDALVRNRFEWKTGVLPLKPEQLEGKRSMYISTFAKKTGLFCLNCVKYGGAVVGPLVFGPKLLFGLDYRPGFSNMLGYRWTGMWSTKEHIYSLAVNLWMEDPAVASRITDAEGKILIPRLLDEYLIQTFDLTEDQLILVRKNVRVTTDIFSQPAVMASVVENVIKIKQNVDIDS